MQARLSEVSDGKAARNLVARCAQLHGAGWPADRGSSDLNPKSVPCWDYFCWIRHQARLHTCVSLLYLSWDCPLLLCRGLCPYCKSLFPNLVVYLVHAHHPFASRHPLLAGFIHRHPRFPQLDNESGYCFTIALFPCYFLRFPITNYSSLPG